MRFLLVLVLAWACAAAYAAGEPEGVVARRRALAKDRQFAVAALDKTDSAAPRKTWEELNGVQAGR